MIAILAAAIADLCGPPPAAIEPADPEDAARYAQAGDDAHAAGDLRIAALAYRKALALDAGNEAARSALAAVCAAAPPSASDDAHETAVVAAALARYRAGDLDGAQREIATLPAGSLAAAFFSGVLALARHDGGTAVRELERARQDPRYADAAAALLPLAHRDGALAAFVVVEPELDSNPQLLPDTPAPGATATRQVDEDLLVAATLTARPFRGAFVRDAVAWRKQRELSSLDFFGNTASAGLELGGIDRVGVRYDFDYDLLAGARYLIAHRASVSFRHELGGSAFVASYALRRRDYQQITQADYTGWVHTADAGASMRLGTRVDLDVRATVAREYTAAMAFTFDAIGATAVTRVRLTPRLRLAASALGYYASYEAPEPDGELRRDGHGEGTADVELDLADHALASCGSAVIGNTSSIVDFRYWKVVVRCGLAFAIGGP